MPSLLTALRRRMPATNAQAFLASHPGAWIEYADDTPAQDPDKALAMPTFHPAIAEGKQQQRCAVRFSLQPFHGSWTREGMTCVRTLGVAVELTRDDRLPSEECEERKEEYLRRRLLPFPLKPHWVIETREGFHILFRVRTLFGPVPIHAAEVQNRRLVHLLQGEDHASLLTQAFRVPGTFQWGATDQPFLCRLLLDDAATVVSYPLHVVQSTLDAIEAPGHAQRTDGGEPGPRTPSLREGKGGGGEETSNPAGGQHTTLVVSVAESILESVPEPLWAVAGWGGLLEWNRRRSRPFPGPELRAPFEALAWSKRRGRESAANAARLLDAALAGQGEPRGSGTPSPSPDTQG